MLVERWHSRNPDELVARLDTVFGGVSGFAVHGGTGRLWDAQLRLALGEFWLTRYKCSGIRFAASLGDKLHLAMPTRGGAHARSRNRTTCTQPFVLGHTLPPNEAFALDVLSGTVTYAMDLPLAALARHAQALVEDAKVTDTIAVEIDLQSGAGAALLRNVLATFNELPTLDAAGLGPLAVAGFSELLVNLLLAAALPKLRSKLADAPARIAPAKAERARQYLEAHAREPIRIADVAAELGIGVRALQGGFRRLVGYSPRQYLIRCRLELARTRLLSPAPLDTVSSIAIDCGFLNLGLFASRYRRTYGELPSQTLARSQK